MGCCCSCIKDGGGPSLSSETEMSRQKGGGGSSDKALCIARTMTQPTITIEPGGVKISGHGLALAGAGIEQDAAYWEWHILSIPDDQEKVKIGLGVAHKKDRAFYNELKNKNQDSSEENGRSMMKNLEVKDGDTIGVAVQQSDLPMVQFLLNGEPLHEHAINRFRGLVYPSIHIPESESGSQIELVMNENKFRQMSPHARFGPVIVARGLI